MIFSSVSKSDAWELKIFKPMFLHPYSEFRILPTGLVSFVIMRSLKSSFDESNSSLGNSKYVAIFYMRVRWLNLIVHSSNTQIVYVSLYWTLLKDIKDIFFIIKGTNLAIRANTFKNVSDGIELWKYMPMQLWFNYYSIATSFSWSRQLLKKVTSINASHIHALSSYFLVLPFSGQFLLLQAPPSFILPITEILLDFGESHDRITPRWEMIEALLCDDSMPEKCFCVTL